MTITIPVWACVLMAGLVVFALGISVGGWLTVHFKGEEK